MAHNHHDDSTAASQSKFEQERWAVGWKKIQSFWNPLIIEIHGVFQSTMPNIKIQIFNASVKDWHPTEAGDACGNTINFGKKQGDQNLSKERRINW